jgi:S-adenosylmethionine-dependent methyltransferase
MVAIVTTASAPRMTPARQRVVWQLLVDELGGPGEISARAVLDCGGGSGSLAVPMAELGAQVTVVDVSVDALATLTRRAAEAAVLDRVRALQGELESLSEVVGAGSFDLVLAHGVLEAVDDPAAALAGLARATRAGGAVSVLISNPVAAVLSRVLAGDAEAALGVLRSYTDKGSGTPGLDAGCLSALCEGVGLRVESVHGIGVFAEIAPGGDSDSDALAELEQAAAGIAPYRDIAARIHLLARKPAAALDMERG